MTSVSLFARIAASSAPCLSAAVLTVAMPTAASAETKTKPMRISAKVFPTPESRLCMPADVAGVKVAKGEPKVKCLNRAEWEAQGVAFEVK